MAGNENNIWGQHDLSRLCFGLDMDHSLRGLHKDFASLSQTPYFSDSYLDSASLLRPPQEGDQVVPSAQQRCTPLGQREAKPLPPLPDPEELMSDEAADQEVEFFTSDRCCLLPKSPHRASGRHHGKVNRAYEDAALRHRDETLLHRDETLLHRDETLLHRDETLLHRDETLRHRDETLHHRDETLRHRDETLRHRDETLHHRDAGSLAFSWPGCDDRARSTFFGDNSDTFWTKADSCLSPKTRFSCAVPPVPMDKPEVPPRIPIKPKNLTLSDDKPPKVPPRVPLVPPCPPRTPSPKSLPIYINGVMPPTQSFAANPNYVSKSLQRQHSERVASAASPSPCIVPILKDGRQASTTHYILLPPGRPSSAGRRDRLQSEPTRKSHSGFWKKR